MRFISGITNVGKEFLKALDARFLLDQILHPIFNRPARCPSGVAARTLHW